LIFESLLIGDFRLLIENAASWFGARVTPAFQSTITSQKSTTIQPSTI
jgi:hypothetical protein